MAIHAVCRVGLLPLSREDLGNDLPRMLGFEEMSELPEEALDNPLDYVLACSDSEVLYLDEHIRKLFEELQLDEDTLVILTADHGEEFLDHGEWKHGQSLFHELVRVPLGIKFPGADAPRGRVTEPVSTMDGMPTLVHFLGGETSPQERGLRPQDRGDPSRSTRPWETTWKAWATRTGVRRARAQLRRPSGRGHLR